MHKQVIQWQSQGWHSHGLETIDVIEQDQPGAPRPFYIYMHMHLMVRVFSMFEVRIENEVHVAKLNYPHRMLATTYHTNLIKALSKA